MRVDSHRFTLRKTVRVGSHRHSVTKTPCEHPRTVFLLREPRSSVVMRGLRKGKTVRVSSHGFALKKDCARGQGQGSSSYIGPSAPNTQGILYTAHTTQLSTFNSETPVITSHTHSRSRSSGMVEGSLAAPSPAPAAEHLDP